MSEQKTILFQIGIMKLCIEKKSDSLEDLNNRLNILENKISNLGDNIIHKNTQNVDNSTPKQQITQTKNEKSTKIQVQNIVSGVPGKKIEKWPEVVEGFKKNGKIMLYTNLLNSVAKEINDMTVGIEFPKGLTSFGKTVLEKSENMNELTKTISMQCGKEMRVKLIDNLDMAKNLSPQDKLVSELQNSIDMPINIIEE